LDGQRKKRGMPYFAPLTPLAKEIIEVYRRHPERRDGFIFPWVGYDAYRWRLNNVSDKLGFKITSHMGRHTRGITLLNDVGFSIEGVSGVLGHGSVATTQKHYADVRKERIMRDMANVKAMNELKSKTS
jgi:integrase/recombinase XerD